MLRKLKKAKAPLRVSALAMGADSTGMEAWAAHMTQLATQMDQVAWRQHRIVARASKRLRRQADGIRARIELMPVDIIALVPSARWLFDNFQMLYREIGKLNLSASGRGHLPVLRSGPYKGLPRVYVIASYMVELTQGFLHEDSIALLIKAYQQDHPLTDRELHALIEMLGLCLLGRILDIAGEVLAVADKKSQAEALVAGLYRNDQDYPDIAPLLSRPDPQDDVIYFHSHVLYTLKNLSVGQSAIQRYLDTHFHNQPDLVSAADVFLEEGRQESQLESAIRGPITSLKELNEIDSEVFLMSLSALEAALGEDPDGIYPQMDSTSRAQYRDVAERLSIATGQEEMEIAQACLALAQKGQAALPHPHHVGSYLIGPGKPLLRRQISGQAPTGAVVQRPNYKGVLYFLLVGSLSAALLIGLYALITAGGYPALSWQSTLYLLCALPLAVGLSTKIANSLFTRSLRATRLPALDYAKGIPEEARTMVVMPVILANKEQGLAYLGRLHKHYLANRQRNLYFALLADYKDAQQEVLEEDSEIRDALVEKIAQLNHQMPSDIPRFSLLMRKRLYNPAENRYMCWERKRGKLEEFNRLIVGEAPDSTSFHERFVPENLLTSIRYVITLDADSDMVMASASQMVGTIHHPLNRPLLDAGGKAMRSGYAIIQPQVMNHIPAKSRSVFQQVYAGKTGLPSYSMASANLYQDVFAAGIFVGKGIYDAHAFHHLLHGAIPENRVLSHDLLESSYARTGFGSQAIIVENFPGTFASYLRRQHRWIRGDWQLLPWLFKREVGPLSKWKMLDNLRASLQPTFYLVLLLLNLAFFPRLWYLWLLVFALPLLLDLWETAFGLLAHKLRNPRHILLGRKLAQQLGLMGSRVVFDLVFLPGEAANALDAIIKTLYRYLVSKRHFLLWDAADQVERTADNSLLRYLSHLWLSIPIGLSLIAGAIFMRVPLLGLVCLAFIGALFALSFVFAYQISRPRVLPAPRGIQARDSLLFDAARRAWRFFQDYATREHNHLCPDNVQIGRAQQASPRTSPTNIGLQLLSALSAYDLGFESMNTMVDAISRPLSTIASLPKWKGHLYNWYDTGTLQVLPPRYVSTVDSGNLTGHLIAVKNGLKGLGNLPLLPAALIDELRALAQEQGIPQALPAQPASWQEIVDSLEATPSGPSYGKHAHDFIRLRSLVLQEVARFELAGLAVDRLITLGDLVAQGQPAAMALQQRIVGLVAQCQALIDAANFADLYNGRRKLFFVGFNETASRYDSSCYDLAASESLLLSLVAIAKGDVSPEHWKRLGRPLTVIDGLPAHVSWSGTMFEYLMPQLVMHEFAGSVFEDSSRAAVLQQMRYAQEHQIPWGISESQYYLFDTKQNYQYKAFGVPSLRLAPTYQQMQVVSPYASLLALEYAGQQAINNLQHLYDLGAYGEYGFFEAVDFTTPDPITLRDYCLVKSFMAHHQGMGLVATNNYVNGGIMRQRFHDSTMIQAAQPLLEEKYQPLFAPPARKSYAITFRQQLIPLEEGSGIRHIKSVNLPLPATNYLSNGAYSLLITSDGDGFGRWHNRMLYRWRPDGHAPTGLYVYIRDTASRATWSAAHNPTKALADSYQADFHPHQAVFSRQDSGIATTMQVSLMPNAPVELRRITLRNLSGRRRSLAVTAYLEVVLDTFLAESSHPAFNKLFIQTEYLREQRLFIASRRGGEADGPFGMLLLLTGHELLREPEYEHSRLRFIGRNNSLQQPQAVCGDVAFSNSDGFTPDPILSMKASLSLNPGQEAEVTFVCGMFDSREALLSAASECGIHHLVEDAALRFRQQSLMELRYLGITGRQLRAFHNIIRQLYYPSPYYRGPEASIRRNWTGQSGLWKFGISGDKPILLLYVQNADATGLVGDVLKMYEYLSINSVPADLVILADSVYGYANDLIHMLNTQTATLRIYDSVQERTGIYILHTYELSPMETDLLLTAASVVFTEETGIYFRRGRA